jgi:hypothetical protein
VVGPKGLVRKKLQKMDSIVRLNDQVSSLSESLAWPFDECKCPYYLLGYFAGCAGV